MPASADWVLGSGRAAGMGNAGLAVPYDIVHSGRLNPAIYGLASGSAKFEAPRISTRLKNIGFGDLADFSGSISSGGFDSNDLSTFARRLGDENVQFGLGANLGIFAGGLAVSAQGDALASTVPNAALQTWVQGGAAGVPPGAAQLDAYGLGGYELGFAYGRRFNTAGNMDLSIGVRAKVVRSYYSHYSVNSTQIENGLAGSPAPEMGGSATLSKDGFGLDLGVIASASKNQGFFFGAVVNNLIEPDTSFAGTFPNSVPGLNEIKPHTRTVSLGTGYMSTNGFVIAVDLADAFNSAGSQELRAGMEWAMGKSMALRAGYSSRFGGSVGLGFGGFNIAYGGNSSGQLSYALRF